MLVELILLVTRWSRYFHFLVSMLLVQATNKGNNCLWSCLPLNSLILIVAMHQTGPAKARQSYKVSRLSHVRSRTSRPSFIQINPIFMENLPFPHQYQFPGDCCRNKGMTLRRRRPRQVIHSTILEGLLTCKKIS